MTTQYEENEGGGQRVCVDSKKALVIKSVTKREQFGSNLFKIFRPFMEKLLLGKGKDFDCIKRLTSILNDELWLLYIVSYLNTTTQNVQTKLPKATRERKSFINKFKHRAMRREQTLTFD
jgi:hypothetical protein